MCFKPLLSGFTPAAAAALGSTSTLTSGVPPPSTPCAWALTPTYASPSRPISSREVGPVRRRLDGAHVEPFDDHRPAELVRWWTTHDDPGAVVGLVARRDGPLPVVGSVDGMEAGGGAAEEELLLGVAGGRRNGGLGAGHASALGRRWRDLGCGHRESPFFSAVVPGSAVLARSAHPDMTTSAASANVHTDTPTSPSLPMHSPRFTRRDVTRAPGRH